jgi:hypothetical protein
MDGMEEPGRIRVGDVDRVRVDDPVQWESHAPLRR